MANLTSSQKTMLRMIASRSKTNGYSTLENGAFFEDRLGVDYVKTRTNGAVDDIRKLCKAELIKPHCGMILITSTGKQKTLEIIEEGLKNAAKPKSNRRPCSRYEVCSCIKRSTQAECDARLGIGGNNEEQDQFKI